MYNAHFGFREKPFKLVPNPEYLFLSRSHEEALGHLNYAISQGDGFVEITGEVGTGKTTLCRAFLESLDEATVAAYIFNPKLGPKQLLKTINDEFGIPCDADDTKGLIDTLNAFLMQKKAEKKRAIVVIDEAQNLSRTVLEQLRLLSNLETNREKLLQIILVGQPELSDMLDSHELRQIGQRISLRYRITPLSFRDTQDYIQYRLNVASQKGARIFDTAACRHIFAHSQGIPRVINIACDRALLAAFSLNRATVTGRIARMAIKEMTGRSRTGGVALMDGRKALGLFAGLGVLVFALLYHQQLGEAVAGFFRKAPAPPAAPPPPEPAASRPASGPPAGGTAAAGEARPAEAGAGTIAAAALQAPASFQSRLRGIDSRTSRASALKSILELWGEPSEPKAHLEALDDDYAFFNLSAKAGGFLVHRFETDLTTLRSLNMPAILEFQAGPRGAPVYLTLAAIEGRRIALKGPGENAAVEADAKEVNDAWSGVAYLPWKNFLSLAGTIPGNAPADSVLALKMLLQESGHAGIAMTPDYDSAAQRAVEALQTKYGIQVDGTVGPLTKIVLYREQPKFKIPRLVAN
ncbi:MAG: AAA family ATPase [Desulfobacterales bacterium]|jgi:general secretion pathway protein A|nr:AAA family ATPase [Desulfobacterales bacterium]